jgi:hypothetical protein
LGVGDVEAIEGQEGHRSWGWSAATILPVVGRGRGSAIPSWQWAIVTLRSLPSDGIGDGLTGVEGCEPIEDTDGRFLGNK